MTDAPIEHYVNKAEFNPESAVTLTPEQERYYMASQWRLMWWKLRRHRLAVISGIFLAAIYLSVLRRWLRDGDTESAMARLDKQLDRADRLIARLCRARRPAESDAEASA